MPEWKNEIIQQLAGLNLPPAREAEIVEEVAQHLEDRYRELLAGGMAEHEARRVALQELSREDLLARGLHRVEQEVKEEPTVLGGSGGDNPFGSIWRDLRFGARQMWRNPGFAAVAVLSLALGIGANALVFSVVNALVLKPLPVEHPDQLAFLENKRYGPSQSFPNYKDLRDRNRTFAGLVGYRVSPMELELGTGANRIWGYLATGNYFDVLGVKPALGRFFHQSDDLHPGASPYAVLAYNTWQSRFGADPNIVGKTVRINRLSFTVLGVAPRDFHGTELFYWPEVWVPMMMEPQIEVGNPWLDERSIWNTWVVGRLKPGVSPAQAEANLNTLAAELAREHPVENDGLSFMLAKPGMVGDMIGSPAKAFTLGVLGLAALVLLAACVNLASLLTVRASDRQRELAIRLAMGAGRRRLIRQVLTEAMMLAVAGGATGFALAVLLSRALSQWRAPLDFPVQFNVDPDWRVFCFAWAASIIAGILFAAVPAWRASKTDPNGALKGSAAAWGPRRLAFRDVLVVVQVAVCFVLVSGCLLSLRGLQQALRLRLGFDPQHVSVAAFELGLAGYSEERGRAFQQRALQAVEQLPGVESAAYSNSLPLSIDQSHTGVFPADAANLRPSDRIGVGFYEVSPGFFATLGTRLMAGRDFNWHDDPRSPQVAIVNLAFAKRVLHTENQVGGRFRHGAVNGDLVEVIGVVEDGKYGSLTETAEPVVFWPILQRYNTTTTLEVKSSLPPSEMVGEIRRAIAALDPELPLYGVGSLTQMLGFAFFPTHAAAVALSAFGLLALMLAATGIYGLVAYAVSRRVREIGIRMALGARPAQVLRLVLGKMMALLAVGSALGLGLALVAGQVLASIVYEASPRDPVVLAGVAGLMCLLGLFASWLPGRRALGIEPKTALHYE
ncbi:MAG: ADOP family duplicated permease [Terriglobia bacterium]